MLWGVIVKLWLIRAGQFSEIIAIVRAETNEAALELAKNKSELRGWILSCDEIELDGIAEIIEIH